MSSLPSRTMKFVPSLLPILTVGLLAAAAAAIFWVPSWTAETQQQPQVTTPQAPMAAMWTTEGQGDALEGVALATNTDLCGLRDQARACLEAGSRGSFLPDGGLELQEGRLLVQSQSAISVSLLSYAVQASEAADFNLTLQSETWTVAVASGSVTVTGPDLDMVVNAGESLSSADVGQVAVAVVDPAPQDKEGAESVAPEKKPEPVLPADELLDLARSQRAAKDFKAAAKSYEQFVRAYPKNKKVPATLVSLAQLYQGPLNQPQKALRHFNRYLKRGGPLAEEAHYGKIRALRSLGKTSAADKEVEAFLGAYPSSAYADALSRGK